MLIESTILCPECAGTEVVTIEQGSSYLFYRCKCCNTILKPKASDCCVLCSFGSVSCISSEQNLAA